MEKGYLLALVFGIAIIGFLSSQDAFAFGGTISDGPSCTATGVGSWDGVSTCTIGSIFVQPTVGAGETLTISPGITVNIGTNALRNSGTINNHGTININNILVNNGGTINNHGTIIAPSAGLGIDNFPNGILNNYRTLENNELIRNNPGTINNFAGATLTNNGVLAVNLGGTINNSGTLVNTGRITTQVGVFNNPGTINNHNLIDIIVTAGNSPLNNSGTANNICFGVILGPVIGNPVNSLSCQPGSLQFSSAIYSISEDGGSAKITVSRLNGIDGAITVNYATSDGTATAGSDYTATSGTLSLGNFVTSQTFLIPILADAVSEGSETVNISLSNPAGGATLGSPSTAVLTINNVVVIQCQIGYYSATGGEPCIIAPPGTYVNTVGATSPTQCPAGQYQDLPGQTQCKAAPAGSYASGTGNTGATQCPAGTFTNIVGSSVCTPAPAGSYASGTGNTGATQCMAGSYQPLTGQTSCNLASPGYFVAIAGSTLESACPVGFFQPLTGQTSCNPASLGHYVPAPASIAEIPASSGHYVSTTASSTQTQCPAGTYQPLTGQTQCIPAPAGSFATGPGATNPLQCPAGTYQPDTGSSSCFNSDSGFYVPNSGATEQTQCPAGTTSSAGAIQCTPLPPIASDDLNTTNEDTQVITDVLTNDTNLLDTPLLVSIETNPSHGQVSVNLNKITYTPDPNFNGQDSYKYRVIDASGDYAVASVNIVVIPINDAPLASAGADQTADEGTQVTLAGSGSDLDGDTLSFSWAQIIGTQVILSNANSASPSFTAPPVGAAGQTLTFTLTVSDGLASATDTVSILINNVDLTPPEAYNQFDPVTKNVLVFGTDDSDGNLGPIQPKSVTPTKWSAEDDDDKEDDKTNAELRTYEITDASGNKLTLKEIVKIKGKEIKVKVLSIQYGNNPEIMPLKAKKNFEWSTNKDGTIKELEQKMTVGKDKTKQEVKAKYDSKKNQTKIESEKPKSKQTLPGLVLLKMGTSNGSLVISH